MSSSHASLTAAPLISVPVLAAVGDVFGTYYDRNHILWNIKSRE